MIGFLYKLTKYALKVVQFVRFSSQWLSDNVFNIIIMVLILSVLGLIYIKSRKMQNRKISIDINIKINLSRTSKKN